jgi:hypothetical protein
VFDTTLTDIEFKQAFVNRDAEWLRNAHREEPDLSVDGLRQSLLSRLLALLGLQ